MSWPHPSMSWPHPYLAISDLHVEEEEVQELGEDGQQQWPLPWTLSQHRDELKYGKQGALLTYDLSIWITHAMFFIIGIHHGGQVPVAAIMWPGWLRGVATHTGVMLTRRSQMGVTTPSTCGLRRSGKERRRWQRVMITSILSPWSVLLGNELRRMSTKAWMKMCKEGKRRTSMAFCAWRGTTEHMTSDINGNVHGHVKEEHLNMCWVSATRYMVNENSKFLQYLYLLLHRTQSKSD